MSSALLSRLERFSRLRFDSKDDALSHARHIVQQSREVSIGKYAGRVERYLAGYDELHLTCRWRESEDFTLIARIVPNSFDLRKEEIPAVHSRDANAVDLQADEKRILVLGWVRELPEQGEQVVAACVSVPFGVWHKLQQIGVHFTWDSAPRPPGICKLVCESFGAAVGVPEREIRVLEASRPKHLGGTMDGLIEASTDFSQIPYCVSFDVIGDILGHPDLINQLAGISISLGDRHQIALVDKCISPNLDICDISMKPLEWKLRAIEWVKVPAHDG